MIEKALTQLLSNDETISGIVADRITPMAGEQSSIQPRLVYQVTGDDPIGTFDGPSSFTKATIEIDSIADTVLEVVTLSKELKRIFDWKKIITEEVYISPSRLTDETDIEEALIVGTEMPCFIRTQTFVFQYRALDEYGA